MGEYVFKLPDVGEGIAESEIALWRVQVGDVVSEDQPLVDMLTEKAAVEIPSPVSGRVMRLHGEAGDKVAVGGVLITLDVGEPVGDVAPPQSASAACVPLPAEEVGKVPAQIEAPVVINEHVAAAPTVRKRARELGVDLRTVRGSGPSGRILHADLDACVAAPMAASEPSVDRAAPSTARDVAPGEDDATETIKIIGLRRKIAEAMQRSKQRIPHFAYVEEVDVTELEALRVHLNGLHKDRQKLTLLPLLIQALVRSVPAFPMVNATFDDEAGVVTRHRALHVGIATQTPSGLAVPVLRHAQRQDLWQRSGHIKRLAEAARAGKGTREELSGSTITLTSLGALGGIVTTPVINAPEVAIVGVNKMVERPVVRNGRIVVRTMMNLSSS
ncbi:MAG: dihydrolipoamide acetyltransferase family protein, partial [Panacagrimonas sp.]